MFDITTFSDSLADIGVEYPHQVWVLRVPQRSFHAQIQAGPLNWP